MSDIEALASTPARMVGLGLGATRRAEPAGPWPRTIGLTVAFGVSLALWAALIEGGLRLWSMLGRL